TTAKHPSCESLNGSEVERHFADSPAVRAHREHGCIARKTQPSARRHSGSVERNACSCRCVLSGLVENRKRRGASADAEAFTCYRVTGEHRNKDRRDQRNSDHHERLPSVAREYEIVCRSDQQGEYKQKP